MCGMCPKRSDVAYSERQMSVFGQARAAEVFWCLFPRPEDSLSSKFCMAQKLCVLLLNARSLLPSSFLSILGEYEKIQLDIITFLQDRGVSRLSFLHRKSGSALGRNLSIS